MVVGVRETGRGEQDQEATNEEEKAAIGACAAMGRQRGEVEFPSVGGTMGNA